MEHRKNTFFVFLILILAASLLVMNVILQGLGVVFLLLLLILVMFKPGVAFTLWSSYILFGFVFMVFWENTSRYFQKFSLEIFAVAAFISIVAMIHVWQKNEKYGFTTKFVGSLITMAAWIFFSVTFFNEATRQLNMYFS